MADKTGSVDVPDRLLADGTADLTQHTVLAYRTAVEIEDLAAETVAKEALQALAVLALQRFDERLAHVGFDEKRDVLEVPDSYLFGAVQFDVAVITDHGAR